jgi:hypothetical protein
MGSTAVDDEVRRSEHRAGGLGHLIASKEHDRRHFALFKFDALVSGYRAALADLAATRPHVVNELLACGLLSADRYLQMIGPHGMIEPPVNALTVARPQPPLLAELDAASKSGVVSAFLSEMLTAVVASPDSLIPVSLATLARLRATSAALAAEDLREVRDIFAVVAICAGYDLGEDWTREAEWLGVARWSRSQVQIASDLFTYGVEAGMNVAWLTAIREWGSGTRRFDHP